MSDNGDQNGGNGQGPEFREIPYNSGDIALLAKVAELATLSGLDPYYAPAKLGETPAGKAVLKFSEPGGIDSSEDSHDFPKFKEMLTSLGVAFHGDEYSGEIIADDAATLYKLVNAQVQQLERQQDIIKGRWRTPPGSEGLAR